MLTQAKQEDLQHRFQEVSERIAVATEHRRRGYMEYGKPLLVAVSKGHSVEDIRCLYDLGVRDFGESYANELMEKRSQLPDDIRWHFIGRLQSNKAKMVAGSVELIHSVDRMSLIQALDQHAEGAQKVLIQLHIGEDDNKGGVTLEQAPNLLEAIVNSKHLVPCGVMAIPPMEATPEQTRKHFRELYLAYEKLRKLLAKKKIACVHAFQEVSMGMSEDFGVAIEEGATMVRIGSSLFGPRDYDS